MKMKRIFFALSLALAAVLSVQAASNGAGEFRIGTYNLRNANSSDSINGNRWTVRGKVIAGIVRFNQFDIFGTQEGFRHQLNFIKANLPGFEYIGVGRDDGRQSGEHSAIFYNTDVFDVLDSGNFWLSETPDIPSKGWDAANIRICTWGRFLHKDSGREFLYFNLHADHVGVKARSESVKLIIRKIQEFNADCPVFLSGDFNIKQENAGYKEIVDTDIFSDSRDLAEFIHAPTGTFNGWETAGYTNARIDHIFVSQGIKVHKYGILTDTYRTADTQDVNPNSPDSFNIHVALGTIRVPSDHYPVLLTVELTD